ncbi:hypothetical protein Hypma_003816 [Hypsizygus marmoreus]|uniref:Uncharacterized protein n=1 Tax=Hypsizygus marmoreus TaxID=39966 RepID=A0A369K206_HYPMA|nr:hypothetical protein Hypma_003816 [Hypsizygus marmoreus]
MDKVSENSPDTQFAGVVLGVIGAAMALMVKSLALIGFSAGGPIAGSIAAAWQASIGNVVAGSVFALLQSIAMTGAGAPILGI